MASDGYDYPAIRTGGTYEGIISEKNKTNGYLPPSVSVLKGGADCGYTWDHDVGIDTTFSGNYIATRCRNGSLTVPNVDRKLEVNIPYTELPQLDPVRFSTENGKVVVIPPGYAQTVTVLVDGQVEQTIQGASYTLENMGGDNGFTLTGGSFGVETGSVPQAFCSNAASGIYRLSKIVLNAPEAMSSFMRFSICASYCTLSLEKLRHKQYVAERKLTAAKHKEKRLQSELKRLTRSERTHRLCTRAGMLETFLKEPTVLTDEDVMELLTFIFQSEAVQKKLNLLIESRRETQEADEGENP